jgi:hypothetical protein
MQRVNLGDLDAVHPRVRCLKAANSTASNSRVRFLDTKVYIVLHWTERWLDGFKADIVNRNRNVSANSKFALHDLMPPLAGHFSCAVCASQDMWLLTTMSQIDPEQRPGHAEALVEGR